MAPTAVETYARPTFVTYSFPATAPSQIGKAYGNALSTWSGFDSAEKEAARAALKAWGDASGLTFIEVKGSRGDILFNWLDFDPIGQGNFAGFAYFPSGSHPFRANDISQFSPQSGDVYLNSDNRKNYKTHKDDLSHLLLHEIGHALGLKHPFESSWTNARILARDLDTTTQTVMSYTGYDPQLGPLDKAAIKALYGGPSADGTNVASWKWVPSSQVLAQAGTAKADLIYGVSVRDTIKGGGGNDRIWGFAGNDVITGGGGNDVIAGGAGRDAIVFNAGLNRKKNVDRLTDFAPSDDTIRLENGIFDALKAKGALGPRLFHEGRTASDADDRILYDAGTGILAYDPDGTGPAAAKAFAILTNRPGLVSAADFLVI